MIIIKQLSKTELEHSETVGDVTTKHNVMIDSDEGAALILSENIIIDPEIVE